MGSFTGQNWSFQITAMWMIPTGRNRLCRIEFDSCLLFSSRFGETRRDQLKTKQPGWSRSMEWRRRSGDDAPKRASLGSFLPASECETQLSWRVGLRDEMSALPSNFSQILYPTTHPLGKQLAARRLHIFLWQSARALTARRSNAFELRSCLWRPYWVGIVNRWSKDGDLGKGDIRRRILDSWDGPGYWPPRLPPTGQLLLPGATWAVDRCTYSLYSLDSDCLFSFTSSFLLY